MEALTRIWWTLIRPPWRDPLNVLVSFAFGMTYYLLDLSELIWGDQRQPPWLEYTAMLVVICVAQLFRVRAPSAALRVGVVVFLFSCWVGTSLPIILILCDLLYSVALYGPRRSSRFLIKLLIMLGIIAVVGTIVFAPDKRLVVVAILGFLTVPVMPVWWGMQVRVNRELAAAETARAEEIGRLADLDRRAAVAAERGRMARDLHDVIAGHMSAIAIQSEAVLAMPEGDRDTVNEVLRSVRENSLHALTEMRTMIGLLRGDESSDERTAPPRLSELAPLLESARAAGVDLEYTSHPLPELPAAVELAAYRIIQEGLTNVVKHAPGSTASLAVKSTPGLLTIDLANVVFSVRQKAGQGSGVQNMRERTASVGGTIDVGPQGERWVVHAELPLGES